VKLLVGGKEFTQKLEVRKDPRSAGTIDDIKAQTKMQLDVREDLNAASDMISQLEGMKKQLFDTCDAAAGKDAELAAAIAEMGKKMLYIPGIMSVDEIQTIASLAILGHIAKLSATYNADLEVPNKDPLTFAAARETVKEAYLEAGRPDLFREEMVNYVTYDQFAYTASVTGKMVREKPATNFLIGSFYAESLLLAETGQSIGAIQISGTAEVAQRPFFVVACDYTLIGEELYAASAYLSREPVLLGSLKGQDAGKIFLAALVIAGTLLSTLGIEYLTKLFEPL
jgi:hypothetical protein